MLKRKEENQSVIYADPDYWMRRASERMKKEKEINLDDALFDSEEEKEAYYKRQEAIEKGEIDDFPEEYYHLDWNDTPEEAEDEKIRTQYDFSHDDFKNNQYYIYRQLINISSLLSDIKEVLSDGNKAR